MAIHQYHIWKYIFKENEEYFFLRQNDVTSTLI